MSCHIGWSRKFLLQHFPKSWIDGTGEKGYRNARKASMLEREKGKIQETLVHIKTVLMPEKELTSATLEKNVEIAKLEVKLSALGLKLSKIALASSILPFGDKPGPKSASSKKALLAEKRVLLAEKRALLSREKNLSSQRNAPRLKRKKKSLLLLRFCPSGDCRGMIDEGGHCVLCKSEVCLRCHSEKLHVEDHTCNEDDVKSVVALVKQAKPCPSCGVVISKISGCDQMWCPSCKTTFSWERGVTTHESVHNPHAIRWARENGDLARDALDVPCGGFMELMSSSKMASQLLEALQGTEVWENAALLVEKGSTLMHKAQCRLVSGDILPPR